MIGIQREGFSPYLVHSSDMPPGHAMDRHDLLNLPTLRVVSVDDSGGQYTVMAEADTAPDACPRCGASAFYGHGTKPQLFVDMPSHGHYVTIQIDRRRFRCRACNATTLQPLPDMALTGIDTSETRSGGAEGHLMTRRLVDHVGKAGLRRTFADVAHETGLDDRTVRRIVSDHIGTLETRYVFETPDWLGLDEIHILGKVCGVVTNVQRHCLVNLLPGRNEEVLGQYIAGMRNRDLVEIVTIDMWRPYARMAAEYLPKAAVVIDRFHVVRMANDALDKVRKAVQRELPTGERVALKHQRGALAADTSITGHRAKISALRRGTHDPICCIVIPPVR